MGLGDCERSVDWYLVNQDGHNSAWRRVYLEESYDVGYTARTISGKHKSLDGSLP